MSAIRLCAETLPSPRRIPQLAQDLGDLSSRDEAAATAAAARVAAQSPTGEELAVYLGDRNPFIRSGAARWLRHAAPLSDKVASSLRAAIYDQNPYVVQAALGSAGVLRLQEARGDARTCLDDSNPCVIHAAVFALGRIGPSEEGAHLIRFIDSTEQHVQIAAVNALAGLMHQPAVPALMLRLDAACGLAGKNRSQLGLATRLIHALATLGGTEAVPLLVRIAREEVGLRGLAVQALIDLRAEEAAPALVPLLTSLLDSVHEERLCCRLLFLMTAVDYRFAMPAVRAFLGHRQPGVRCAALKAVASWRDTDAIDAVRRVATEDPSAFVRPAAVSALVELAGKDALPDLEKLAADANALVRGAVATSLAGLGEEGRSLLSRLMSDEAQAVARAAQEALIAPPPATAEEKPTGVPLSLRGEAAAARAFLKRWQAEQPADEVAQSLRVLVTALAG